MKKSVLSIVLTASLLGAFSAPATAAPQLSAQSIIVNPVPTTLQARVWVDRDRSGNAAPNYRVGDRITLYATVNENAYVYLFNVNPDGTVDQILPNRFSGSTYLRAGQTRAFPSSRDRFTFDVAGPEGLNRVLVVASRRPLNLNELSSYAAGEDFATVKPTTTPGFAQALSIVVNPVEKPIPQKDWTSDTANYNVSY